MSQAWTRYFLAITATGAVVCTLGACSDTPTRTDLDVAAQLGKGGGKGGKPSGVIVTAELADAAGQTAAGLYSDGWIDEAEADETLNTRVEPACPDDHFVLIHSAPPPWLPDVAADCAGSGARAQLMIPGVLSLADGDPVGSGVPVQPGEGLGAHLNYFFNVDSSNKGKGTFNNHDDTYDYVWTDATVAISDLDSDGDDDWHITGATADLITPTGATRDLPFALDVKLYRQ